MVAEPVEHRRHGRNAHPLNKAYACKEVVPAEYGQPSQHLLQHVQNDMHTRDTAEVRVCYSLHCCPSGIISRADRQRFALYDKKNQKNAAQLLREIKQTTVTRTLLSFVIST